MPGTPAPRIIREQRRQFALTRLAAGRPYSETVAELALEYGCSRRMARNYCAAAMAEIVGDLETVDHKALLASTIHRLERIADRAERSEQYGAAVGAIRTLSDLVLSPRLGKVSNAPPHRHHG